MITRSVIEFNRGARNFVCVCIIAFASVWKTQKQACNPIDSQRAQAES